MSGETERMAFIVNPNAAAGATLRRFERFRDQYGARLGNFEVRLTQKQGDATQLTRAFLEEAKAHNETVTVISVGGDGTMNEVVNGFFAADETPIHASAKIAVFPSGTGGDFPRTFKWTKEFDATFERIRHGNSSLVDVGVAHMSDGKGGDVCRYFLNIGSFGLTGAVDQVVNGSSKALGPHFSFVVGLVRAFSSYKAQSVRLQIDDEAAFDEEISVVAMANGQYFGGGMWIAPQANVTDGLFHIVRVCTAQKRFWLKNAAKVYSGSHTSLEEVKVGVGRTVRADPVRPGDTILIDLDGEQPGILPATFKILPKALRLLV